MKTYLPPLARVLPFCPEAALLQCSTIDIEIDDDEDVDLSDKSNRRSFWDYSI